jgi:hypothetical protein
MHTHTHTHTHTEGDRVCERERREIGGWTDAHTYTHTHTLPLSHTLTLWRLASES